MKSAVPMACLATVMLSGCLTISPLAQRPAPAVPSVEASMAEADTLLRANQRNKAIAVLLEAAANHPTKSEPVLRVAQLHYDRANYGEAITHAAGALEREPSNLLANSILAVSGLRVSTKALADLAKRNNISGSVRSEATDLAQLIRASLGEKDLLSGRETSARAPTQRPTNKKTKPEPNPSDSPFDALK